MKLLFSVLSLIVFTGCSVSIVQNTGKDADILEDNDSYDVEARITMPVSADIPVNL